MEEKIIQIETMLAYHQKTLDELCQVVLEQRREIDALTSRLKDTENQTWVKPLSEEAPPPHY